MNRGDRWLVVLALLLTMVGLVMVYSSGSRSVGARKNVHSP